MDEDVLPISALQHYAYCPRQFALIHVEQSWAENFFTAEGRRLHERVDSGSPEQRRGTRFERGVLLLSQRLRLSGKMDLLEIENGPQCCYFPVEYKRGKPKVEDWDRIQLCAQALCLEEMRGIAIQEGAIWYWEVRRRVSVIFDETLRSETLAIIEAARAVLNEGRTPPPLQNDMRCRACSLVDVCRPGDFRQDRSARYIEEIFQDEEAS
jgi:CRISPR-associated exonuclease Cas4